MYTLEVSYNCGMSYVDDCTAATLEELDDRCRELDSKLLRWSIHDGNGNLTRSRICALHAGILIPLFGVGKTKETDF